MKTRATWEQYRALLDAQPETLVSCLRTAARGVLLENWPADEGLGSSDISCKMYDLLAYHCGDAEEFSERMIVVMDCQINRKLYLL